MVFLKNKWLFFTLVVPLFSYFCFFNLTDVESGLPILFSNFSAPSVQQQLQEETYDLRKIHAPAVSGWALKAFDSVSSFRPLASLIIPFLLNQNHFFEVAQLGSTLNPPAVMYPLIPPTEKRLKEADPPQFSFSSELSSSQEATIEKWSIEDYANKYREKRLTPLQVTEQFLVNQRRPEVRNIITQVNEEDLKAQARRSTQRHAEGRPLSLLDGVPVAVKEDIDVKGYYSTSGSAFLNLIKEAEDSPIVRRLRAAGALIVGKANMHEFGFGVTGLNPLVGSPLNPHNITYLPGGSSSGPATAVASGLVPLAVGSDGGGSVRIPSCFCGVFGLKATFGRVALSPSPGVCPSLVHLGPIARHPRDLALAYSIIAGKDVDDPQTHLQPPVALSSFFKKPLSGLRIGVFWPHYLDADPLVIKACNATLEYMTSQGAVIVPISIPFMSAIVKSHTITFASEFRAFFLKFMRGKEGKSHSTPRWSRELSIHLQTAAYFPASLYLNAQKIRSLLLDRLAQLFREQVDVIASPTVGVFPPKAEHLDEGVYDSSSTVEIVKYVVIGNLAGVPAISIPVGKDDLTGLPIGMQLMASHWREDLLLSIANQLHSEYLKSIPLSPAVQVSPFPSDD